MHSAALFNHLFIGGFRRRVIVAAAEKNSMHAREAEQATQGIKAKIIFYASYQSRSSVYFTSKADMVTKKKISKVKKVTKYDI